MAIISGAALGPELCRIFKLDPTLVKHITIDVPCDDVIKVFVTRYMTNDELKEFTSLLMRGGVGGVVIEEKIDVR